MKIICISDTHGQHDRLDLPECDLIIHAGDATGRGRFSEFEDFTRWFGEQKSKYKIYVAGNHDMGLDLNILINNHSRDPRNNILKLFEDNGIIYLEDKSIEIDGIKIYGTPISPNFGSWAFMRSRGEAIKRMWDMIPKDTQILITHGPPMGIMDKCKSLWSDNCDENVGCEELLKKIKTLPDLKMHVFGHIHEGSGHGTLDVKDREVIMVNASSLDERYSVRKNNYYIFDI